MERTQRCAVRRSNRWPSFAAQDRSLVSLADHQVDDSRRARHEGDRGLFVPFAEDAQCPVAALHGEVLDAGGARFGHARTVETPVERQALRPITNDMLGTGPLPYVALRRARKS
jgi:hypothetical protein